VATQAEKARALAAAFGAEVAGALAPSGIPIEQFAERYGTPFYLYDGGLVIERVRAVRAALGTEVSFSIKANPSLAICQLIAGEAGVGAEVASAGELALALAAGFEPSDIVFAGPGKTDDELARLVAAGILADNAESLAEIDRLGAIAERLGRRQGVSLRLNPEAQLLGAQMRMGGTPSQFGIDEGDLDEAVARVLAQHSLEFRGIHVYTATQVFQAQPLLDHCRNILDLALRAADRAGRPIEVIDFGGGFGIPYFDGVEPFHLQAFGTGFRELLAGYRDDTRLAGCRYVFELGRYLVADAGLYVMRAIDRKTTRGRDFLVTDGGMNHHLTATGNMGQVFRKPYPLLNLSRLRAGNEQTITVTGPLCTPLDSFGEVQLVEPAAGDLIGVLSSGAYGYSASNLGFLSHPTPAEVLVWRGEAHLLRPAGEPEDVLIGQAGLPGAPKPSAGQRVSGGA
jgi:diaminopimelate decarboxylase